MTKPTTLFACIHNSGRSVAGHALARHYGKDAVEVRSAGSAPGDAVNPTVAEVLAERGLAVSQHTPAMLNASMVEGSDVVITMGCGETCPVFRVNAMRTGRSRIRADETLRQCAASSTTSTNASGDSSASSLMPRPPTRGP